MSTLLTFGIAFVLCRGLTVLTSRRGDRRQVDLDLTIAVFDHVSLSSFLQVSPACRNANFYPDLEQLSSNDKTVSSISIIISLLTVSFLSSLWTCITLMRFAREVFFLSSHVYTCLASLASNSQGWGGIICVILIATIVKCILFLIFTASRGYCK